VLAVFLVAIIVMGVIDLPWWLFAALPLIYGGYETWTEPPRLRARTELL